MVEYTVQSSTSESEKCEDYLSDSNTSSTVEPLVEPNQSHARSGLSRSGKQAISHQSYLTFLAPSESVANSEVP